MYRFYLLLVYLLINLFNINGGVGLVGAVCSNAVTTKNSTLIRPENVVVECYMNQVLNVSMDLAPTKNVPIDFLLILDITYEDSTTNERLVDVMSNFNGLENELEIYSNILYTFGTFSDSVEYSYPFSLGSLLSTDIENTLSFVESTIAIGTPFQNLQYRSLSLALKGTAWRQDSVKFVLLVTDSDIAPDNETLYATVRQITETNALVAVLGLSDTVDSYAALFQSLGYGAAMVWSYDWFQTLSDTIVKPMLESASIVVTSNQYGILSSPPVTTDGRSFSSQMSVNLNTLTSYYPYVEYKVAGYGYQRIVYSVYQEPLSPSISYDIALTDTLQFSYPCQSPQDGTATFTVDSQSSITAFTIYDSNDQEIVYNQDYQCGSSFKVVPISEGSGSLEVTVSDSCGSTQGGVVWSFNIELSSIPTCTDISQNITLSNNVVNITSSSSSVLQIYFPLLANNLSPYGNLIANGNQTIQENRYYQLPISFSFQSSLPQIDQVIQVPYIIYHPFKKLYNQCLLTLDISYNSGSQLVNINSSNDLELSIPETIYFSSEIPITMIGIGGLANKTITISNLGSGQFLRDGSPITLPYQAAGSALTLTYQPDASNDNSSFSVSLCDQLNCQNQSISLLYTDYNNQLNGNSIFVSGVNRQQVLFKNNNDNAMFIQLLSRPKFGRLNILYQTQTIEPNSVIPIYKNYAVQYTVDFSKINPLDITKEVVYFQSSDRSGVYSLVLEILPMDYLYLYNGISSTIINRNDQLIVPINNGIGSPADLTIFSSSGQGVFSYVNSGVVTEINAFPFTISLNGNYNQALHFAPSINSQVFSFSFQYSFVDYNYSSYQYIYTVNVNNVNSNARVSPVNYKTDSYTIPFLDNRVYLYENSSVVISWNGTSSNEQVSRVVQLPSLHSNLFLYDPSNAPLYHGPLVNSSLLNLSRTDGLFQLVYTPNPGEYGYGYDSFFIALVDVNGTYSIPFQVIVNVPAPNIPPIISTPFTDITFFSNYFNVYGITIQDPDAIVDPISLTLSLSGNEFARDDSISLTTGDWRTYCHYNTPLNLTCVHNQNYLNLFLRQILIQIEFNGDYKLIIAAYDQNPSTLPYRNDSVNPMTTQVVRFSVNVTEYQNTTGAVVLHSQDNTKIIAITVSIGGFIVIAASVSLVVLFKRRKLTATEEYFDIFEDESRVRSNPLYRSPARHSMNPAYIPNTESQTITVSGPTDLNDTS